VQTKLAEFLRDTPAGSEAAEILGRCVHCGFCTATCPTYRLLGDELDGPRGRIYLIKQVVEGVAPTARTQLHLDRCLTCRACETTCPSGVEYGRLLDIGRELVDREVQRPLRQRVVRTALREVLTRPLLFAMLWRLGQVVRPWLPATLQSKIPRGRDGRKGPLRAHARKVLLLSGCVQPAMMPSVNAATARVLDSVGLETVVAPKAGCCGAVRHHAGDPAGALDDARRNIDAWWPLLEAGAESIVINASACTVMARDYAHLLRHDPAYAEKARVVSERVRDVAQIIEEHLPALRTRARCPPGSSRIAFQSPCTLQHGLRLDGTVRSLLAGLGAELLPVADSHQCCGSAGTYSILQATMSNALRERKLATLTKAGPQEILSANVGCISHLAAASDVPVRHWIEWVDEVVNR
jgi:glycolate oxidase iron-sulfur subunit